MRKKEFVYGKDPKRGAGSKKSDGRSHHGDHHRRADCVSDFVYPLPLAILLVDSFVGTGTFSVSIFSTIFAMPTPEPSPTPLVGFLVGILSALIGLLFACRSMSVWSKFIGWAVQGGVMLPVVSPPFVLSLSMIMLFGRRASSPASCWASMTTACAAGASSSLQTDLLPVCYMMLKGLLKNVIPSLEKPPADMDLPLEGVHQRDAAPDAAGSPAMRFW